MKFQNNVPLKNKNWFQTGGNARYFCQPTNEDDFAKALEFAANKKLEIFVLGQGAKVLISDDGFGGLVIQPQLDSVFLDKETELITAQAGITIQKLIDFCLQKNLIGLEEFSGIPGTIGGAVYMNIHYIEHFFSNFLMKANIINKQTRKIKTVGKDWFNFGYDKSKLQEKNDFLISATFNLNKVDNIKAAYAKGKSDEIIRQRNSRYPISNTCGSFFKNFEENEINFKINGKKILSVAYYLDKLGIKGELRVGNAIVSSKHANMIETLENATSNDVMTLAKKMQELVFEKFKILPQPECQLIGFEEYPF